MPDADSATPLCSSATFVEGGFADLVANFSATAISDMLIEATRKCEGLTGRRLTTFTNVAETVYATGINPDEYAGPSALPLSIQGTVGLSEAMALGVSNLVRRIWVAEYPPRYPEMWTASPNVSILVIRSIGGTSAVQSGQILEGPDDKGHILLQLGTFVPAGSMLQITYSGGYTTVPADLVRACRYIAAGIAVTELDPEMVTAHDPDRLFALGQKWLAGYERDGSPLALARRGGR